MKTFKKVLILSLWPAFVFAQVSKKQGTSEKGDSKQLKVVIKNGNYTKAFLSLYTGLELKMIDSSLVNKQNEFVFTMPANSAKGFYNVLFDSQHQLDVLYNNENVELKTRSDYFIDSVVVLKSAENKLFYEYLKRQIDYSTDMLYWDELEKRYVDEPGKHYFLNQVQKLSDSLTHMHEDGIRKLANENSTLWMSNFLNALIYSGRVLEIQHKQTPTLDDRAYLAAHYFDNVNFADERFLHSRILHDKYVQYFNYLVGNTDKDFVEAIDVVMKKSMAAEKAFYFSRNWMWTVFQQSGKKDLANYVFDAYPAYTTECFNKDAGNESPEIKLTKTKQLQPLSLAPVLDMPDTAGAVFSLRNANAKATMLVFWQPGCKASVDEVVKLQQQINSYEASGLLVCYVAIESTKQNWLQALKQNKLKGTHVSDLKGWASKAVSDYNVNTTTQYYLLDEVKKILLKNAPHEQLDAQLKQLFVK